MRALALVVLLLAGLVVLLVLRLLEWPVFGANRPVSAYVPQWVCRQALRIIGLRLLISGEPMEGRGAAVANHSSWLDIFVLNATKRIFFVSKSEVASWPGIGWLARATGTVFIERNPTQARAQTQIFQDRLTSGHRLLFFPEGTSTDGQQVLGFKTTLFQAFFIQELYREISVQPVSVRYDAPAGADPRFYGWWGDMGFGPHLLAILAPSGSGRVALTYHAPLLVSDYPDRKALARACEAQVRAGHEAASEM